ncbi:MAG: hypothetical protein BV456_13345 [Thermoplasmata archaeon M8B2D]|nr:MAG: hypothetical protein BV456_13345 [Thermoplasmata archaeon M8B2D]
MAKVTEQDLIKLGFNNSNHFKYYRKDFEHIILCDICIKIIDDEILLGSTGKYIIAKLPLTHDNLDLFIRFAKGEKL